MESKEYWLCSKDLMEKGPKISTYIRASKDIVHVLDFFGIFYQVYFASWKIVQVSFVIKKFGILITWDVNSCKFL